MITLKSIVRVGRAQLNDEKNHDKQEAKMGQERNTRSKADKKIESLKVGQKREYFLPLLLKTVPEMRLLHDPRLQPPIPFSVQAWLPPPFDLPMSCTWQPVTGARHQKPVRINIHNRGEKSLGHLGLP